MKRLWQEHTIMILCGGVACVLLVAFGILQFYDSPILKLDAKWLGIAGLPILVGLVAGGYITKFKGFGMELESKLKSPVGTVTLTARSSMATLPGDEKQSVARLPDFTEEQVARTKRLSFISGRRNFYGTNAIILYLKALTNLEYVEVKKESGEFICLVPVEEFRRRADDNCPDKFSLHEVQRFVEALGEDDVLKAYRHACVSLTVKQDEPLLTTLKVLRDNGQEAVAVVTPGQHFVGLLTEQEIEHRIADEILASGMAQQ